MFKKRGFTQVDWAISLAIFLLYLAWFFVIIKPQVLDSTLFAPNIEGIKQEFLDKTNLEVGITPIFIESDQTLSNQIIELDVDFSNNFVLLTNKPYFKEGNTLYILDDLNNHTQNIYYLTESENTIYQAYNYQDQAINYDGNLINLNSNITISYNQEIENISFNNEEKIISIKHYQNDIELTENNFSINNKHIFLELKNEFQPFRATSKLISGSNNLINKIKKLDKYNDINVTIEYELQNYDDYFINNDYYGIIDNIDDSCIQTNYDSIKLIKDAELIYFIFNKDIDITICESNTIIVSFDFENQNLKYDIVFGSNTTDLKTEYGDYDISFGLKTITNYPTLSKIENLTYQDLNPDTKNIDGFMLTIYNTTSTDTVTKNDNLITTIGSIPEIINTKIYSKESILVIQDEYANTERLRLNVKVW